MLKGKKLTLNSANPPTKLADAVGDVGPFTHIKVRVVSSTGIVLGGDDITATDGYILGTLSITDIVGECRDDFANKLYFGGDGECFVLAY